METKSSTSHERVENKDTTTPESQHRSKFLYKRNDSSTPAGNRPEVTGPRG